MTSNLGSQLLLNGLDDAGEISEAARSSVLTLLSQTFRPELLNRIDETVLFRPLSTDDLARIVTIQLDQLNTRLKDRGLRLSATQEALAHIATASYDPRFGARPLRRFLQREVETPLARQLIGGQLGADGPLELGVQGEKLTFSLAS